MKYLLLILPLLAFLSPGWGVVGQALEANGTLTIASPLPPDAARGADLFSGRQRLQAGGGACLSCHQFRSPAVSMGGRLGPDLTDLRIRFHGQDPIASWLHRPPTPVMGSLFAQHPLTAGEIADLAAFLSTAPIDAAPAARPRYAGWFIASAVIAAFLVLVAGDRAYQRRRRQMDP